MIEGLERARRGLAAVGVEFFPYRPLMSWRHAAQGAHTMMHVPIFILKLVQAEAGMPGWGAGSGYDRHSLRARVRGR